MQTRQLQLRHTQTHSNSYMCACVCVCGACDSVGEIKIAAQQTAETQRGANNNGDGDGAGGVEQRHKLQLRPSQEKRWESNGWRAERTGRGQA